MKLTSAKRFQIFVKVAPLAGAWIEILSKWIDAEIKFVAPLAGAWIEIVFLDNNKIYVECRSPRGSVD